MTAAARAVREAGAPARKDVEWRNAEMSNLNKVFLMGRLTRDPELRYTPQGMPVSDLGLAVNREYTTQGGERKKDTLFVDVTVWKRQAELCCQYLKKGSPIFIEGRLAMDSWEGQDGQKRTRYRVVADNFQFIGGGGGGRSAGGEPPGSAEEAEASGGDYGGNFRRQGAGASMASPAFSPNGPPQGPRSSPHGSPEEGTGASPPGSAAAQEEFAGPKEDDIPF